MRKKATVAFRTVAEVNKKVKRDLWTVNRRTPRRQKGSGIFASGDIGKYANHEVRLLSFDILMLDEFIMWK